MNHRHKTEESIHGQSLHLNLILNYTFLEFILIGNHHIPDCQTNTNTNNLLYKQLTQPMSRILNLMKLPFLSTTPSTKAKKNFVQRSGCVA
jgi:hypothetical protein